MNIAVTGTPGSIEELKLKVPSEVQISTFTGNTIPSNADLIIDLDFDLENLPQHYGAWNKPVIINGVFRQLASVSLTGNLRYHAGCTLFGMCTLPTLINRPLVEVSSLHTQERPVLEELARALNWQLKWVDDRIGMVTPRIIAMIINEAYFTLQEGTASKEDIDLGMKLGTNYPHGPFEWAQKIGLYNVYRTLDAVYHDTRDERYKICPLLKTEMLRLNLASSSYVTPV